MKFLTCLLGLAALLGVSACRPGTTTTTLTVTYDLPHPIASLGTPTPEVSFNPGQPPVRVIHGIVSDGSTHSDSLRGTLLAVDGKDPSAEVRFHFLSPGHASTQTVTLEGVRFSGNTLDADYRVVTPTTNTADFRQFGSLVVVTFR